MVNVYRYNTITWISAVCILNLVSKNLKLIFSDPKKELAKEYDSECLEGISAVYLTLETRKT